MAGQEADMDGQGTDDRRMHEGEKPGLAEGRERERQEAPIADGDRVSAGEDDEQARRVHERDIAESIPDEAHERAE
jgi:hypothetical protein